MGITISQPADGSGSKDSSLAVAAVAEITQFSLVQLQALQAIWYSGHDEEEGELSAREADIGSEDFEASINSVQFAASDRAIFDRMFTLMDRTGDDRIFAVQFLIGASLLLRGSLEVKLQAALQFTLDAEGTPEEGMTPHGLSFALTTLSSVAGFFGDPPVSSGDINEIVEDTFRADHGCTCQDLVKIVAAHHLVQQYAYPTPDTNEK